MKFIHSAPFKIIIFNPIRIRFQLSQFAFSLSWALSVSHSLNLYLFSFSFPNPSLFLIVTTIQWSTLIFFYLIHRFLHTHYPRLSLHKKPTTSSKYTYTYIKEHKAYTFLYVQVCVGVILLRLPTYIFR